MNSYTNPQGNGYGGGYQSSLPSYPQNYPQGYTPPVSQYNPTLQMEQRLRELERQNPQYGNTAPPAPAQTSTAAQNVRAILVTSIDEAKAQPAQLDGSKQVFLDTSNGKIYTKQFNIATGGADFRIYENTEPEESAQIGTVSGIEDPNDIPGDIAFLEERIEKLEKEIKEMKGDAVDVQSADDVEYNVAGQSTDAEADPAATTNEPRSNATTARKSTATKSTVSKQSNASTAKGKK